MDGGRGKPSGGLGSKGHIVRFGRPVIYQGEKGRERHDQTEATHRVHEAQSMCHQSMAPRLLVASTTDPHSYQAVKKPPTVSISPTL